MSHKKQSKIVSTKMQVTPADPAHFSSSSSSSENVRFVSFDGSFGDKSIAIFDFFPEKLDTLSSASYIEDKSNEELESESQKTTTSVTTESEKEQKKSTKSLK